MGCSSIGGACGSGPQGSGFKSLHPSHLGSDSVSAYRDLNDLAESIDRTMRERLLDGTINGYSVDVIPDDFRVEVCVAVMPAIPIDRVNVKVTW